MTFTRQRLLCATNGPHWADRPYTVEQNRERRKVLRCEEECERPGCQRVRTTFAHPKTFEILYRQYTGEQESITRGTARADLRRELYLTQRRK